MFYWGRACDVDDAYELRIGVFNFIAFPEVDENTTKKHYRGFMYYCRVDFPYSVTFYGVRMCRKFKVIMIPRIRVRLH